jgi:hypothetical protein
MVKYRSVSYPSHGTRYLQIVRDIKLSTGRWTTKIVTHLGLDDEVNKEKAGKLISFLKEHASNTYNASGLNVPIAVGTIDEDFLAGVRLGILIGPLNLPIVPMTVFGEFLETLEKYVNNPDADILRFVEVTQQDLTREEKEMLVKWINSLPGLDTKTMALFFKWSYKD